MEFLLVMVAAAAVILIVSAPFRRVEPETAEAQDTGTSSKVAELEAAREAKYREIRDAELDHRTGKLSDEDFHSVDNALRAEAISILQALDRAKEH
jgi:transcriptional regulator of heat shock response